jgi:hypothetical protein
LPRAATCFRESLAIAADLGSKESMCENLEGLARIYALQAGSADSTPDVLVWSARLLGAAAALRESSGVPLTPAARPGYDEAEALIRATLGETVLAASRAEGAALPLDVIIAQAAHPLG